MPWITLLRGWQVSEWVNAMVEASFHAVNLKPKYAMSFNITVFCPLDALLSL
jgi:hypothetical protein